jgi:pSer/pThr/pTyr-binding forkhead associated (FHA) protein
MKTKFFLFASLMYLFPFMGMYIQDKNVKVKDILNNPSSLVLYVPDKVQIAKWFENNLLEVVIGGSVILLIILVIVLISGRKSGQRNRTPLPEIKPSQPVQDINIPTPKENLKTMIIPATSSKTIKFIPGVLEVMTGDDKGRTIRISGYPTQDGSTVTVGREPVSGPRDFAHIQFKERTISRKQAEIIYKDGKLFIKNLSETNYTKLDGMDIPPNKVWELKSGSIISFGEIEMKYNT